MAPVLSPNRQCHGANAHTVDLIIILSIVYCIFRTRYYFIKLIFIKRMYHVVTWLGLIRNYSNFCLIYDLSIA